MIGTLICIGILIMLVACMELLAFLLGVRVAQKLTRNEEVKLPNMNPVRAYRSMQREYQQEQQEQKEKEELSKIIQNIDNYDGTGLGQIDIK
jgi:predicted Holliday junction resolvase-like endonuclease